MILDDIAMEKKNPEYQPLRPKNFYMGEDDNRERTQ